MIRVLIVDDHAMVREGLQKLLTEAADIDVVGLCSDGQQALTLSAAVRPDVVLMDIQMPVMSGIEATAVRTVAAGDVVWPAAGASPGQ